MLDFPQSRVKTAALIVAALSYVAVGVTHFTHTDFFLAIMPPYLPAHLELVLLSGVFEVLGGLGLLVKRTRRFASLGLVALLLAVYPANIHMAMNPELYVDLGATPTLLYLRLPVQFVFIGWAYWVGT
jgi:uncharacterized membrane protein